MTGPITRIVGPPKPGAYGRTGLVDATVPQVGESGDEQYLDQAGTALRDLSRIEHEAMQALSRLVP